jgi:hypothetical protein
MRGYDVSQRRLAQVLGISAPMLSQLISARRVKMGNTLAYERMVTLERHLPAVTDGTRSGTSVLVDVAAADIGTTTQLRMQTGTVPASEGHAELARSLRRDIPREQLRSACDLLRTEGVAPDLRALLEESLKS